MTSIMVRYKLKPDRVEENERLVRAVFAELGATRPAGVHYATFKLEDGVSFVHIVHYDTTDARNVLRELPAFRAFTQNVADRCEEKPVSANLTEVGTYGFPGD